MKTNYQIFIQEYKNFSLAGRKHNLPGKVAVNEDHGIVIRGSNKFISLFELLLFTSAAAEPEVPLTIDVFPSVVRPENILSVDCGPTVTVLLLGGAPRPALLSPPEGPWRAGVVGGAGPGEGEDAGEAPGWTLRHQTLACTPLTSSWTF